jgi:hypothetical protein
MDIITFEQALTQFWADALGKTVDTDIFRGGIPPKTNEATAVIINSEVTHNEPAIRRFNAQLIGRCIDRDSCLIALEKAASVLPVYSQTITVAGKTITIKAMLQKGSGGTYKTTDQGRIVEHWSYNFIACFAG